MKQTRQTLLSLLAFCTLGGAVLLTVALVSPPAPLPVDAPATAFSAGRAMQDLEVIAREPHPMGPSPAHAEVRDYLLGEIRAMGLEPQVQDSFGVRLVRPGFVLGGFVENILVRLPGTDPEGAILLVSHYDTTPANPGAACSTSGVVTILEILRALQSGPPLRQDVIALFTDGEEPGTIGAHAFVAQHPWLADVGYVVNMDQYWLGAPNLQQTSGDNGMLIQALARNAPSTRPSYFSFPFELFPSGDMDLLPFLLARIPGAAISTIVQTPESHTMAELPGVVDPGSVQQAGNQILALVRTLGNQPTLTMNVPDQTYFPVLGRLVHYPVSLAWPLAVLAGLSLLGTVVYGFRRRGLTWRGLGLGILTLLVCLVLCALIVNLLWSGIQALHPEYGYAVGRADESDDYLYTVGFATLALGVIVSSAALVHRKVTSLDLAAGVLVIWLLVMIAATILLPASSYLFTWLLLINSLALLLALAVRSSRHGWILSGLGALAAAILSTLLWVPWVTNAVLTGPTNAGFLMMSLPVLASAAWFGSMIPALDWIAVPRRWLLPAAAFLAALGILVAGHFLVGRNSPPAWVNSIGYWMSADDDQAYWVAFIGDTRVDTTSTTPHETSFPEEMDARQLQVMVDPVRRPYTDLFPAAPPFSVLTSAAPRLEADGPRLELLADAWVAGRRIVTARITTSTFARLYIILPEGPALLAITVPHNERMELPPVEDGWMLRFDGMDPEGVEVSLEFSGPEAIQVLLVEEMTGLPSFPGPSLRPVPGTMQGPGEFNQGVPADFAAIYRPIDLPAAGGE